MRLWITLLLLTTFLNAGDKIALLIGNNNYSFQPLDNPLNDVDGIYKTLREIGFEKSDIKVLKNVSKNKMENELANFSQRATSAEIALVYFSGHGMQVNNTNYMFPANTTATKPIHLRTLVDLDYFIQSASSAKYGVVLVDACRNNPLVKYFQNGKHKGSNAKKGLGQVTPTVGQVVIGFATSAGDTADDGSGSMSPYAFALAKRLKEKDDIRNVLGKVAKDVSGKYEQNPIYRSNLAESVFFNSSNNKKDKFQFNIDSPENLAKNFISTLNSRNCNQLKKFFVNPFLGDGKPMSGDKFENYCQKYYIYKANKNLQANIILPMSVMKDLNANVAKTIELMVNNLEEEYDEIFYISLSGDKRSKYIRYQLDLIIVKKKSKYYIIGDMR